MSDLVERISFIVPLMSISFIAIITSINLYIKIRQYFPVRVNCWFCRADSKVPYHEFNSWTCGSCDQYNGFDKDGNYNRDIPAQRSIQLNKRWKTGVSNSSYSATNAPATNGLCETCNRNQEIKMQQLASFEPEEKFDDEIEHFRERLEKSYELCYSCQRIVKKTLSRVMNDVLGLKLAQIGAKGLQVLDRQVKGIDSKKRIIFNRVSVATLIILAIWNLYNISTTVNLSKKHLDAYFPPLVTHIILMVVSYISAIKLLLTEYLSIIPFFNINFVTSACDYVTKGISGFLKSSIVHGYFNETFLVNLAAVLLSLALVLGNGFRKFGSISIMLLWNVNMLWPQIAEVVENDIHGDLLKVCNATLLFVATLITSLSTQQPTPEKAQSNNSFHRIYSNCDEELSENSDGEATLYSDSYTSTPRSRKIGSPPVLNNSFSSVKSITPPGNVPWMSSTNSFNNSFRNDHQYSFCQQSSHDLFSKNNNLNDMYFFPNKTSETKRCSSMNSSFRIPDECHSKLTDLNISGMSYRNSKQITCLSPTPSIISLNRHRSQLLTPSRLSSHSPLSAPATKSSWVAGGFFMKNNMSPQKRQQSGLLHPMLSRTSSQSSGFESHSSSAHNGNANGSRESSIAGDAISIFSEPTLIADSASQMGINDGALFASTLSRPKPFFPTLNKAGTTLTSSGCKSESLTNYSMFPWTNHTTNNGFTSLPLSSQPVYHQFGTHRHSNFNNDSVYNKCSSHSSTIRKGSLIKPLSDDFFFNNQ